MKRLLLCLLITPFIIVCSDNDNPVYHDDNVIVIQRPCTACHDADEWNEVVTPVDTCVKKD